MKQLFMMLLATIVLVACKDKKKEMLDPSANVYISAQMPKSLTKAQGLLTPKEIVEKATMMQAIRPDDDNRHYNFSFQDFNRDIEKERFAFLAMDIINFGLGYLQKDFIVSRDYIFVIRNSDLKITDTIAYIPNAVMIKAEREIRAAYAAEEYTEVYRLFQNAFAFIPINGAEWLKLKAKNEN